MKQSNILVEFYSRVMLDVLDWTVCDGCAFCEGVQCEKYGAPSIERLRLTWAGEGPERVIALYCEGFQGRLGSPPRKTLTVKGAS